MKSVRFATLCLALTFAFRSAAQQQITDRRLLIVLIGPTGSGKTTQAEFLKSRFGVPTVAIDDVIRDNPAAVAQHRSPSINSGPVQLSPVIDTLIAERLTKMDVTKGIALDGYPATKGQADHLTALAKKLALGPPIIIQIDVPDDIVRERLKKRNQPRGSPQNRP